MTADVLRRLRPSVTTIVVTIVVLLVAELGAGAIEPRVGTPARWGVRQTDTKIEQMEALADAGGVDVVFIGSSIVDVGVDPAVFSRHSAEGLTAYNASMSAASPQVLEAWAAEQVFPLLDPSIVVIGLSSRELNDNGLNQADAYNRYVASAGRRAYLSEQSLVEALESDLNDASALFRMRSVLRSPYRLIVGLTSPPPESRLTELGHDTAVRHRSYQVTDEFRNRVATRVLHEYAINGVELAALGRIVAEAQSRGARVYIVDMPVVETDWVPLHPDGWDDLEEYDASLAELSVSARVIAARARGGGWDAAFFADPVHLNAAGSERLSRWLGELLSSK